MSLNTSFLKHRLARMTKWYACLILLYLLTLAGCNAGEKDYMAETVNNIPVLSRYEGVSKVPCFGCHNVQMFFKIQNGVFSHEQHSPFDVHCSDCHNIDNRIINSPEHVKLTTETCTRCHFLNVFVFNDGEMGKVTFNHRSHSQAFRCDTCHPRLFLMKKGFRKMKMTEMYEGRACGLCHNSEKAFSFMECMRCHREG